MFTPNVHEIPSARMPRETDPMKVDSPSPRLDDNAREMLRDRIEDAYRFLMAEPSHII